MIMETKELLQMAMYKCAVAYNPKDINTWCDTHTYSQMAEEMARYLHSEGVSLQKNNPLQETMDNETELMTNDEMIALWKTIMKEQDK